VIKAAASFKDKTNAPNQPWQTDFTYLKVIGWGWFWPLFQPVFTFSFWVKGHEFCIAAS